MPIKILQDEIENITFQLKTKYQAEKVFLFGSAVYNPEQANDLDFLVIKSQIPKSTLDRSIQIQKSVNKSVAADFIVITPDEFSDHIRMENPFVLNILENGKLLYG